MTQVRPTQTAFEKYLSERLQEPAVRAGYEDHTVLQRTIDRLIGFRKALKLTQRDVAERMGVGQPTVSGFETEMSDPRLSTLQRYARAVEARLDVVIDWDASCDWVDASPCVTRYTRTSIRRVASTGAPVSPNVVESWARDGACSPRQDFAFSA